MQPLARTLRQRHQLRIVLILNIPQSTSHHVQACCRAYPSIPLLPSGSLKVCTLGGLSSLIPHTYRKEGTSGTSHPITCCIGTPTHHLVLPQAESPGWLPCNKAADRGQCLLLLPKIVAFKRAGRNIKMFLITSTTFGAPASSLTESVERDP